MSSLCSSSSSKSPKSSFDGGGSKNLSASSEATVSPIPTFLCSDDDDVNDDHHACSLRGRSTKRSASFVGVFVSSSFSLKGKGLPPKYSIFSNPKYLKGLGFREKNEENQLFCRENAKHFGYSRPTLCCCSSLFL